MNPTTFISAALILIADRLTKILVFNAISPNQTIGIVPGIFHLTLVLNKGIAFGLFRGMRLLFIITSLAIIVLIFIYMQKSRSRDLLNRVSIGLIIGGALGNLFDRLKFGYVIDFLDFQVWPVFNIADSSITVGAIILVLRILSKRGRFSLS